ncbi:MAG: RNA polymerase factor sigma-54 [Pseudomonadota bacterium]
MQQSQNLSQHQKMVMTPDLQQSLKILQLNQLDLVNYINNSLQSNPILSLDEDNNEENNEAGNITENNLANDLSDDMSDIINNNFSDQVNINGDSEIINLDYVESNNGQGNLIYSNIINHHNIDNLDSNISELSLKEHVLEQANLIINESQDKIIAKYLIDMLDDNGYISDDFSDIINKIKCRTDDIERILSMLQSLEPAGIFARNLVECLTLQLKDKNHFDEMIEKLLANLNLVAQHDFKKLMKICDINIDDLTDMINEIKSLNPKPGEHFIKAKDYHVIPDIFLSKKDDDWHVELNNQALPKVIINNEYKVILSDKKKLTKDTKKYLNNNIKDANWLIKSLDRRAQTILKITQAIVEIQNDFFNNGIYSLKPMTLSDIAKKIEMHESTVSRVSNKIIQTDIGLFELKYFFSSALSNKKTSLAEEQDGAATSSTVVKKIIQELITSETKILSDADIVTILANKNINLARRTVAKYREALKIPASSIRRKAKRQLL